MGTLPSLKAQERPDSKQMHPKHYPTSRLDQNKIMFNEIFVKPKLTQLKELKYQREKQGIKLPALPAKTTPKKVEPNLGLSKNFSKSPDFKDVEKSLDISSLIERRRFNKNSDNLFEDGFEEEAFKKIDEGEVQQFDTQDFRDLKEKMSNPGRDISVQDHVAGDENGVEAIMKNFRQEQVCY